MQLLSNYHKISGFAAEKIMQEEVDNYLYIRNLIGKQIKS
jgi:hypothetical protein